jgi:hypothetical protein
MKMSLERAYNNCRICYFELKGTGFQSRVVKPSFGEILVSSNHGERAMNEAMKALEEEIPSEFRSGCVTMERRRPAYEALKVCAKCDGKSPAIAEFLEKALTDIFGKSEESK